MISKQIITALVNRANAFVDSAVVKLNAAVGKLNAAVGKLNAAVGKLNVAVAKLEVAVGKLNAAVDILNENRIFVENKPEREASLPACLRVGVFIKTLAGRDARAPICL